MAKHPTYILFLKKKNVCRGLAVMTSGPLTTPKARATLPLGLPALMAAFFLSLAQWTCELHALPDGLGLHTLDPLYLLSYIVLMSLCQVQMLLFYLVCELEANSWFQQKYPSWDAICRWSNIHWSVSQSVLFSFVAFCSQLSLYYSDQCTRADAAFNISNRIIQTAKC